MWDHMGGYGGWVGTGGITMLLFWIVLILAIAALWKFVTRSQIFPANPSEKNALQILEERYARGEIDQEEFYKRRNDLTKGGSS